MAQCWQNNACTLQSTRFPSAHPEWHVCDVYTHAETVTHLASVTQSTAAPCTPSCSESNCLSPEESFYYVGDMVCITSHPLIAVLAPVGAALPVLSEFNKLLSCRYPHPPFPA